MQQSRLLHGAAHADAFCFASFISIPSAGSPVAITAATAVASTTIVIVYAITAAAHTTFAVAAAAHATFAVDVRKACVSY